MPTVRTTIQPHVDLEVGDAEYLDLKRQGLLVEDQPAAAPAAAPAKTTAAAKTKE
ncbi:hypothetical protein [Streptomyces sp. NBC_01373]|uniref:hypothetical protein n=1 Tax=Streptomyces sp. NBC_01373 TaxID=2903843 RepID=UPI0022540B5F|nr:hypothetical protein [Streptomyces sp. NBC_01373]MCX4704359.1 hypothetical protein [Streptomyces sp. NBC_01373]MCX4707099.1 hypothetical protein [Streptomyces sp. NBC_01373]